MFSAFCDLLQDYLLETITKVSNNDDIFDIGIRIVKYKLNVLDVLSNMKNDNEIFKYIDENKNSNPSAGAILTYISFMKFKKDGNYDICPFVDGYRSMRDICDDMSDNLIDSILVMKFVRIMFGDVLIKRGGHMVIDIGKLTFVFLDYNKYNISGHSMDSLMLVIDRQISLDILNFGNVTVKMSHDLPVLVIKKNGKHFQLKRLIYKFMKMPVNEGYIVNVNKNCLDCRFENLEISGSNRIGTGLGIIDEYHRNRFVVNFQRTINGETYRMKTRYFNYSIGDNKAKTYHDARQIYELFQQTFKISGIYGLKKLDI